MTWANMPFALRTMLTWLVIGPVSSVFNRENGGCGVFQRKPDLGTVRRGGNVGTEWADLPGLPDDLVVGDGALPPTCSKRKPMCV